jgi:Fur family ferric uptake transcriptional regulator
LGLVTVTDMGDGRISYHYTDKGHHHHLICHRCGAKMELDESLFVPLKKTLIKEYGFQADLKHLAIFGRCNNCR